MRNDQKESGFWGYYFGIDNNRLRENSVNNITSVSSTEAVTKADVAVHEAETEQEYDDGLGKKDFGGYEIRVLTGIHSNYPVDTYSREQTGELLDDALYNRNMRLEERFHVVFKEQVEPDIFNVNTLLKNTTLAGEDAYDMAMQIDRYALAAGIDGQLLSYNELPNINLDQPWWNQNAKKDFTINNRLFFTYGDDNLIFFCSTTILAFNKMMAETYNLEDMYQLVFDGKWTYDKFIEMNRAVVADLDGNGSFDINDQWGAIINANQFYPNFWLQDGFKIVEKDGNDLPYFNVPGNEPLISLMIKIAEESAKKELWYDLGNRSDFKKTYPGDHAYDTAMFIFSDNKSLFVSSSLSNIIDARSMDEDFGLLPYPASDEKGPGYIYGSRTFGGFPYVVPITVSDPEMVSTIMEAAACDSSTSVIPVLYDQVLKVKNTRDVNSEKILDMIRKNRITDLGEVYWWDTIESQYEQYMQNGKTDIASKTDKLATKAQKEIDKGIEFFVNME